MRFRADKYGPRKHYGGLKATFTAENKPNLVQKPTPIATDKKPSGKRIFFVSRRLVQSWPQPKPLLLDGHFLVPSVSAHRKFYCLCKTLVAPQGFGPEAKTRGRMDVPTYSSQRGAFSSER